MDVNDIRLFKLSDFYLAPFCLVLLYIFAFFIAKKYRGTEIGKYFFPALHLKMLFTVVYALVLQYYYQYGDTFMYYRAVQDMHRAVSDDAGILPEIFKATRAVVTDRLYLYFKYGSTSYTDLYMTNPSNYAVPKLALIFSLLFSKSYLCISFCLSFFAFGGCWRIFKMFATMYPAITKKLAISILFLPSILFWGGGLLKDSICIGALGYLLYAAYSIFLKKKGNVFISIFILICSIYILFTIKPYILLSVLAAVVLWLLLAWRSRINDHVRKRLFDIVSLIVGLGLMFAASSWLANVEAASQFTSERLLQTIQQQQQTYATTTGSNFESVALDNSTLGMVLLVPTGLLATYFRPFMWEISSPFMLISALEALAFLVLTVMAFRSIGVRRFFSITFSDSTLVFCLVFSLVFGAFVGVSTGNFGALVRYKIPCLPFYLFWFFIVMHKSGKFSDRYIFGRRLF